ncbi:hypothetical protein PBI_ACHEBE_71 [Mycobacterium phage Achebe]|uniref:Uncharacterized protein n=6 Tax=Backyardiganvirus TaxID=2946815 RepID=W0LNR8_9CAUD|nr:hypothetical protein PBI_OBAMA12_74 [Mycobacterium phage Obama12]YP_009014154.1 hypothetical protein WILE_71 [Mycobacterium phage Wile]YP_009018860.1 hypothetical protein LHTSCC_75 [Mycobacterium phage LHTSCC]YP_009635483.1 hypothetical protein FGG52_gp70 [Mycobacterium phage Backyardigan]YP_009638728.1 hypothetical protein FGG45_gp71 [Mycobacterium phage Arturo]YP_010062802.1 hypothetical protein KIY72_gp72 [Mycobacterium phage Wizard007]AOT27578.1 hypothetical protein SEA_BADGER_71 [Myco
MAVTLVDDTVQGLNARIEELEAELALARAVREAHVPEEPSVDGTVIRFVKYNLSYTFAAIRVLGRWYITQDGTRSPRQGHAPKAWDELLAWIGERNWHRIEVLS